MVGVFLLIDIDEACFRLSASRGINALTRGVVPQVVDPGDTLKLGNLLAGLRIQYSQHRWVASAIEDPMMALIARQCDTTRNPCYRPGGNLFALLSIDYA